MSQWRKDPVVDRWVVISEERSKRPQDYKEIVDERSQVGCPLCVENEQKTPPEIFAYREHGSERDGPGWWVRVVPNKFPAVRVNLDENYSREGIYQQMNGLGAHELIIESNQHVANIDNQTDHQVEEIIRMWRDRSLDLRQDKRLKYIQIFKNYGSTAGASLQHTHSQLVAIPMIPSNIAEELEGALRHLHETNRCVYCDIVEGEIKNGDRVITDSQYFLSFVPYAARFPFEIWIIPKNHRDDFALIGENEIPDLASTLRDTLRKLSLAVNNPPYNLTLHTRPVNAGDHQYYHWHIEILPRLTIMAGFELGTGFFINPTTPEMAAEVLRDAEVVFPHTSYKMQEVSSYV